MRTPDYILNQKVEFFRKGHEPIVLPLGSFIKPISYNYVPKETLKEYETYKPDAYTFCYTRYGILPIENKLILEISW